MGKDTKIGHILIDPGQYEHHLSVFLDQSADIQGSFIKITKNWNIRNKFFEIFR